ncbi:MAG: hypothetical protein IPK82_23215 [Polyangiaceae bacterium]|nr:hypothetical protein [Polyangiaceae bacterium]
MPAPLPTRRMAALCNSSRIEALWFSLNGPKSKTTPTETTNECQIDRGRVTTIHSLWMAYKEATSKLSSMNQHRKRAREDETDRQEDQGPAKKQRPPCRWRLREAVVEQSESKDWNVARKEWRAVSMFDCADGQCACSHTPITVHIVLRNRCNGNHLTVGNVCIHQFAQSDPPEEEGDDGDAVQPIPDNVLRCLASLKANPAGTTASNELLLLLVQFDLISTGLYHTYRMELLERRAHSRARFSPTSRHFKQCDYDLRARWNQRILSTICRRYR